MNDDDKLDVTQKVFYSASAWTGITTGKAWNAVKGNETLRSHSYRALLKLASDNEDFAHITSKNLSDLKHFNKWLGITASLGVVAAGIETIREYGKLKGLQGSEKTLQWAVVGSLGAQAGVGAFQALGAVSGRLSANAIFGGPVMGVLLLATFVHILATSYLDMLKKDAYEAWLSKTPWGRGDNRAQWSSNSSFEANIAENREIVRKALFDLNTIINQPTISHELIVKTTAYPQYTHKETVGVTVNIHVPEGATKFPLRVKSNLPFVNDDCILRWKDGVYSVDILSKELPSYLSIQLEYTTSENSKGKHQYWFQHSLKQGATYSAVLDNDKQKQIDSAIATDWQELGSQE